MMNMVQTVPWPTKRASSIFKEITKIFFSRLFLAETPTFLFPLQPGFRTVLVSSTLKTSTKQGRIIRKYMAARVELSDKRNPYRLVVWASGRRGVVKRYRTQRNLQAKRTDRCERTKRPWLERPTRLDLRSYSRARSGSDVRHFEQCDGPLRQKELKNVWCYSSLLNSWDRWRALQLLQPRCDFDQMCRRFHPKWQIEWLPQSYRCRHSKGL